MRYRLSYPVRWSSDKINEYIYLIYLSPIDEELDTYLHHHRSLFTHYVLIYITIQQKENTKEELHKKMKCLNT